MEGQHAADVACSGAGQHRLRGSTSSSNRCSSGILFCCAACMTAADFAMLSWRLPACSTSAQSDGLKLRRSGPGIGLFGYIIP